MYSIVYAHMGTNVIAAQRVMATIEGFATSSLSLSLMLLR